MPIASFTKVSDVSIRSYSSCTYKDTIYVASDVGLFVSRDNGATWEQKISGYDLSNGTVTVGNELFNNNIGVTAGNSGIFVSTDTGETWTRVISSVKSKAACLIVGTRALVASDSGLHVSNPSNILKWSQKYPDSFTNNSSSAYGLIYVPGCNRIAIRCQGRAMISSDFFDTYTDHTIGNGANYLTYQNGKFFQIHARSDAVPGNSNGYWYLFNALEFDIATKTTTSTHSVWRYTTSSRSIDGGVHSRWQCVITSMYYPYIMCFGTSGICFKNYGESAGWHDHIIFATHIYNFQTKLWSVYAPTLYSSAANGGNSNFRQPQISQSKISRLNNKPAIITNYGIFQPTDANCHGSSWARINTTTSPNLYNYANVSYNGKIMHLAHPTTGDVKILNEQNVLVSDPTISNSEFCKIIQVNNHMLAIGDCGIYRSTYVDPDISEVYRKDEDGLHPLEKKDIDVNYPLIYT